MMRDKEFHADIVVSVSGGCVTGVFGPEGASVLLIDFDGIREGDEMGVISVDGPPDSKECKATIDEALAMIESYDRRGE